MANSLMKNLHAQQTRREKNQARVSREQAATRGLPESLLRLSGWRRLNLPPHKPLPKFRHD